MLTGIQYSSQRQTLHSVLHHVTIKIAQGKPGLNITKQNSVQCKVCTCVAMPRYKCLNYTGGGGGGAEGGGQKNRQQVRSQLQRSDKPVFASSQVLGRGGSNHSFGFWAPICPKLPKTYFCAPICQKKLPQTYF